MEVSTDEKGDTYSFTDATGKSVPEPEILRNSPLVLSWADLKPVSSATKDPQTYQAVIALEFTQEGKEKFAEFTRRNVDEILAIVLDGKILSAPTITEPILDGKAVIRGQFTIAEAQQLADFLNARALPVHLKVIGKEKL